MKETREKCYLDKLISQYNAEKKAVAKLYNDYSSYLEKFEKGEKTPGVCFGYNLGDRKEKRFCGAFDKYSDYEEFSELELSTIETELRRKYWKRYFLEPRFMRTLPTEKLEKKYEVLIDNAAELCDFSKEAVLQRRSRIFQELGEMRKDAVIDLFNEIERDGRCGNGENANLKTYKGMNGETGLKISENSFTIDASWKRHTYIDGELNYYVAYELRRELSCLFSYVLPEPFDVYIPYSEKIGCWETEKLANKLENTNIYFDLRFFKNGKVRVKLTDLGKFAIRRINLLVGLDRGWLPSWITETCVYDWDEKPKAERDAAFGFKPSMPRGDEEFEEKIAFPYISFNIHDSIAPGEKYAVIVDRDLESYIERNAYTIAEFFRTYNNDDCGVSHNVFVPVDTCAEIEQVTDWRNFKAFNIDTFKKNDCRYKCVEIGSDEWVRLLTDDFTDKDTGKSIKISTNHTLFLNREVEFLTFSQFYSEGK